MPEKKQKIILDFGCGLGNNFKILSKRGDYFGVDILENNIAIAKANHPEGKFYSFDGLHLPFTNGFFNEIHVYDVLEHVDNLDAVLDELARISGKGCKMFITVPAEISERELLKVKPDYFDEVGHRRIVDVKNLETSLNSFGFNLVRLDKVRGMEAVILFLVFYFNRNKKSVEYQTGSPKFNKLLVAFVWLFDVRLFRTALKYFFFLYIFTLPVGWMVSRLFPKANYLVLEKNNQFYD